MFLFCYCRASVAYLTLSLLLLLHQVTDAFLSKDLKEAPYYSHHNRLLHRPRNLFVAKKREGGRKDDIDDFPAVFRRGGGTAQKGTAREREAQRRAQVRGERFRLANLNLEDSFAEKTVKYTSQFIQSTDTKKNIPEKKVTRKTQDNKRTVEDVKTLVTVAKGAGQFTWWATKGAAGLAWNSAKFAKSAYDKSQTQSSKKLVDRSQSAKPPTGTLFSQPPKISWPKAVEFTIPLPKIVENSDVASTASTSTSSPEVDITPVVIAAAKDVIKEEMQDSALLELDMIDFEDAATEDDRLLEETIPAKDTTLFVVEELVSDVVTEKIPASEKLPAASPISTPAPEKFVVEEDDEKPRESLDTVAPESTPALSNDRTTVLVEEEIIAVSPLSASGTKGEIENKPSISEDATPAVLAATSNVVAPDVQTVSPVSARASDATVDESSSSVESSAAKESSIKAEVPVKDVSAETELEEDRQPLLPIKSTVKKYQKPTYSLIKALYFPWIGMILSSQSPSADIAPTSVSETAKYHRIFRLMKTAAEKYSKPTYSLIKALYFPWIGMILEMQKKRRELYHRHANK